MRDDFSTYPSGYKTFRKTFNKELRSAAKARGFRLTDGTLWREQNEFFTRCAVLLCWEKMAVELYPSIKALESDGLAWDVLGMSSNRQERMSLHATAAFRGPALPLDDVFPERSLSFSSEGDAATVAETIAAALEEGAARTLSAIGTQRRFFELVRERCEREAREEGRDPAGFGYCIALIGLGEVARARAVAAPTAAKGPVRDVFRYGVGDKGDAALIVEYCDRLLAGEGEGHE